MAQNDATHELMDGFFGGMQPAPRDDRDHRFGVVAPRAVGPVDLSPLFPVASDQGATGSCGPHAITKIRHCLINMWRQSTGQPRLDPEDERLSELWAYYWTRQEMGTFPQDSGSDNRALCDAMLQHGAILESDCPWDPASAPQDIQRDLGGLNPPSAPYYAISGYAQVGGAGLDLNGSMQACLAEGYPFVCGIPVYDNFFTLDSSGLSPVPTTRSRFLGGHDIPIGIWLPDANTPGGGRYGWKVSWANFGVEHNGQDGWAFISAAFVTKMRTNRYMPVEGWRIG